MALFVKQNESRTKYQQQIAAELQEKLRKRSEATDLPDGVDDSAYIEGTKRTTSLAWLWTIIIVAFVVAMILLLIQAIQG